jgi:hypothetical protein
VPEAAILAGNRRPTEKLASGEEILADIPVKLTEWSNEILFTARR